MMRWFDDFINKGTLGHKYFQMMVIRLIIISKSFILSSKPLVQCSLKNVLLTVFAKSYFGKFLIGLLFCTSYLKEGNCFGIFPILQRGT